jgi:hypothetical protein
MEEDEDEFLASGCLGGGVGVAYVTPQGSGKGCVVTVSLWL